MSPRVPKHRGSIEPRTPWFRAAMVVVGVPAGLLFKLRYRGVEHLPRTGGVILAVNHISYADPVIIGRFVYDAGRNPRYLAKDSLFDVPILGRGLRGMGQVPVHRGGPHAKEALDSAVEALRRGETIIVYPEGTVTRDPDHWPAAGKTGIARLALLAPEIPVVPVGQWGPQTIDVYRKSFKVLPRKPATIAAGPAVDLSRWRHGADGPVAPTAENLRTMTRVVMDALLTQVEEARGEKRPPVSPPPVETAVPDQT
ncbi:lysophospholipid acyltransferase family protein [Jatrophihabitans sp. YIM 134969]